MADADLDRSQPPELPPGAEAEQTVDDTKPQPFKFADQDWESQDKAEQSFKTLRGQFKSMQDRTAKAEAYGVKAVESANAWKSHADRLQAELDQLRGAPQKTNQQVRAAQAGQPSTGVEGAETTVSSLIESLDWGLINQMAGEHGTTVALYEMADQLAAKMEARFQERLNGIERPIAEQRALVEQATKARDLFVNLAQATYQDGSLAYPELGEPESAEQIATFWTQMPSVGIPKDTLMTPAGVHLAVLMWREWRRSQGSSNQPPTTASGAPTPAAAAAIQRVKDAAASGAPSASGVVDGSSGQPTRPAVPGQENAMKIRRDILNAGAGRDSVLGFTP